MGRACARRPSALRVSYFGRRTSGVELEHNFKKAGELSKGFRWISAGKDRPVRETRCAALAAQRWNRAEPIENRSCNQEREKVSRCTGRIRNFRRLSLELCRRRANPESLANPC